MSAEGTRPRDAATLVLLRGGAEVLMGRRNPAHAFLPGHHVFPGGAVERADHYIRPLTELSPGVAEKLRRGSGRDMARALALAAVRETFEETGLRLGRPGAAPGGRFQRSRSGAWRAFHRDGLAPTLDVLDYIARAITPPRRPRRFDARFLVADATRAEGNLAGNGELLDLQWVDLERARHLTLARITGLVLALLRDRLADRGQLSRGPGIPLVTFRHGRYVTDYL